MAAPNAVKWPMAPFDDATSPREQRPWRLYPSPVVLSNSFGGERRCGAPGRPRAPEAAQTYALELALLDEAG